MEQRLNDLESTIAFQEQTISELNEVIIEQQKRIEELERFTKLLNTQVERAISMIDSGPPANEKPPHY